MRQSIHKIRTSCLIAAMAAALVGCAVGPDYVRPIFDMPSQWRVDYEQAATLTNARWWEQFQDPVLNRLIDTALRQNQDIKIAAERVEVFLGQLQTTRSQFFPQIGYGLNASRNRASQQGFSSTPIGNDPWYNLYQGTISADWQIDLFGRVRRQSESAQARVLASEQGRRGTLLTVVSGVASGYITLRSLDRQLEIAHATAENYAGTLRIFQLRFSGGVVSKVELMQVESQYQQALIAIPQLERQIEAQENLISVLLGQPPGPIERGRNIDELVPLDIPSDLPSSLIERRPDVLQAEQNLVAANADIGVARSLYFPTIALTGAAGSVSTATGDFLSGPAKTYAIAANIVGPVFNFGNIKGQVHSAEALERAAVASYQQTIYNALRDTNDALIGAQKSAEALVGQEERVKALREYARLAHLRFDEGVTGYLEVLYAENELFTAELVAVGGRSERLIQIISVYRALGGGWVDDIDTLKAAQEKPAMIQSAKLD